MSSGSEAICHMIFHARAIARMGKAWFRLRMSRILFAAKHSWTALCMSRPLFVSSYLQVIWLLKKDHKRLSYGAGEVQKKFMQGKIK